MKKTNGKWAAFICVLFFSCTKVISVNLNDANPNIVIIGVVTDTTGPYQVQITKTVNFSASNVFPPVSGATVIITDSTAGFTDSLQETSDGIYTTRVLRQGQAGHTYQLSVSVNGQHYESSSVMPQPVLLDSISFYGSNIFGSNNINAIANFQDPPGIANYYTFSESVNGQPVDQIYDFSDRLSDGKYIRQQLFNDSTYIQTGSEVTVQMNCVDKNVWSYFHTLGQATGNNFQSVSPTNPISNISNNALGYFSAQTLQIKKAILE